MNVNTISELAGHLQGVFIQTMSAVDATMDVVPTILIYYSYKQLYDVRQITHNTKPR